MSERSIDALINEIGQLSVFQLADLVKALQERFGVSASAGMAVAAAPAAAAAEAVSAKSDEKAEYKVEIIDGGSNVMLVTKALKGIRKDLGLIQAKKMVDEAPSVVVEAAPAAEAKAMKEALEAAGAKVKLS